MQWSQAKVMVITFDCQGLVYLEFACEGQMVDQQFYKVVLTHLVNKVYQK